VVASWLDDQPEAEKGDVGGEDAALKSFLKKLPKK
jgi:hypothetical protein